VVKFIKIKLKLIITTREISNMKMNNENNNKR